MKIKHPIAARWSRCSAAGLVLVLLRCRRSSGPKCDRPATFPPKLTLSQIEQLVSHGVPDSTMAAQIQKRGVAFTPRQQTWTSCAPKAPAH